MTGPVIGDDWVRSLTDPALFRAEQASLAHVWTFLGLDRDVKRDGDWIRATIATREVFVQRFGGELRGFENLCVHRFYPLRTAERGNGPVICGFHSWQYNRDGVAVGIPQCTDLYGTPPHRLGARLKQIELATCGSMIFGRFPSPEANQSLDEFLGDAAPILEATTRIEGEPLHFLRTIQANWKLNMQTSLDDYHSPTVHPTTFGRSGYLTTASRRYFRMGAHSAFLHTGDDDGFKQLLDGCRDGTYRSRCYFILHIMPDLVVAHVNADRPFWFVTIHQFSALAADRSMLRAWSFPSPFAADRPKLARVLRPVTDPFRRSIFFYYLKRVLREDSVVCENIQRVAHQIDRLPMLGALEERIAWFQQSIRTLTGMNKQETTK
ncbi:hypothetical protein BH10PSE6_BH10PSE6_07890 [soil metagenome]